ncbi:MAG: DUF4136 domain-containing protein [Acidobacteriota bacterium]|nr:MAG: DUF4136 domain-containing protein [Acidobacteriota bacterium]
MRRHRLIILVVLLMALPCVAQSVSVDYDKDTDFSRYRSYAWKEGTPVPNPLSHQRIVNAIEYHLAMKGFEQVDQDPDMYVSYHAAAKEDLEITDWGHRGPRWGWTRDIDVRKILVGIIVVDMIDADDDKLFWRATASDTVSSKPEKNEKKINRAAKKMFKKFPPKRR